MAIVLDSLTRQQKDIIVKAYRSATWAVKWPLRTWRRATIESRMPLIAGRTWRSSLSPATHLGLVNGSMRYTYRGIRMVKHPIDLALYMKLLWEVKPRVVVEIGSKDGGTATWFGDMMNLWQLPGLVISVDLKPPPRPWCCPENVMFYKGDEADLSPLERIFKHLRHPVIIINDASHNAKTMLPSMHYVHQFLEQGDYFIVEDGFLTEAGLDWDGERQGGPALAIAKFLESYPGQYEVDARYCDFFGRNVTANPNGYLRRL